MCGVKIKSGQSVKDLGVTVSFNLKFSQQCNEAAKKGNRMLGLLKINFHSRIKTFTMDDSL